MDVKDLFGDDLRGDKIFREDRGQDLYERSGAKYLWKNLIARSPYHRGGAIETTYRKETAAGQRRAWLR